MTEETFGLASAQESARCGINIGGIEGGDSRIERGANAFNSRLLLHLRAMRNPISLGNF